jgi:hypothetical protein
MLVYFTNSRYIFQTSEQYVQSEKFNKVPYYVFSPIAPEKPQKIQ